MLTSIACAIMQSEIESSRLRHDGDLREKNRLSRMYDNKVTTYKYPYYSLICGLK